MKEYVIHDKLCDIVVKAPEKSCFFCRHMSDIFYDYSNGPYMALCNAKQEMRGFDACDLFEIDN